MSLRFSPIFAALAIGYAANANAAEMIRFAAQPNDAEAIDAPSPPSERTPSQLQAVIGVTVIAVGITVASRRRRRHVGGVPFTHS